MAQSDLTTAKYYRQPEVQTGATRESPLDQTQRSVASETGHWERVARWISYGTAVAVVVCVAGLAIPYLASLSSSKATHPIDWWLRLGGARSDQTFEKFVRDAAASNQNEWEERYRQSPAFQLDSQPINWQLQPAPGLNHK